MNIQVENKAQNIKVTVDKTNDGKISLVLTEENHPTLGEIKRGETAKLGRREFIVLGHGSDTTAVLLKPAVKDKEFNGNGDYRDSDVRKYCNGEFYKEMVEAVGAENIIKHTVDLEADDGTGKGITCQDNVSILTTKLYRRYRDVLPAMGSPWWTATRVTHDESTGWARGVCCVCSRGILSWDGCGYCLGVRPFLILNSSILVS